MFKPGDIIVSDLDGNEYEVVEYGPRDKLEPVPGARLIGDALIVKSSDGTRHMLYSWEAELATNSTDT